MPLGAAVVAEDAHSWPVAGVGKTGPGLHPGIEVLDGDLARCSDEHVFRVATPSERPLHGSKCRSPACLRQTARSRGGLTDEHPTASLELASFRATVSV